MKKKGLIVIIVIMIIGIIALFIGQSNNQSTPSYNDTSTHQSTETTKENKKILIAYFSNTGNTEVIAKEIQSQTNGDLFKIERKEEYKDLYVESKDEIDNKDYPELSEYIDISQYDIIFIGYPIWWHTLPAPINSFLEHYDLNNKTIIPFCTSSSDDISVSLDSLESSSKNANVLEGLSLSGSSTISDEGKQTISKWLDKIDIEEK